MKQNANLSYKWISTLFRCSIFLSSIFLLRINSFCRLTCFFEMDNENKMRVFHLEEMVIGKICKYHKSFHIFACNVIHFLVLICDIYFCVNIIYVSYYHNKQSIEANFFHVRFELYFCCKICNL